MSRVQFAENLSLLLAATLILAGCAPVAVAPSSVDMGLNRIREDFLKRHIEQLASDEFKGRLPGSEGERLTIDYLKGQFGKLGLEPALAGQGYFQEVPLVGITADQSSPLFFGSDSRSVSLRHAQDFMVWTKRVVESSAIEQSEVVFVGYGVQAPEFKWDDFKGSDVKGKTLIVLVNDPPLPDPDDPSRLDSSVFGGRAMTYYGRWTYKFEVAAKRGAAACFIVHETEPAGYPWQVVRGSWSGEQFDLVTADLNRSRCAVEGWLTYEAAQQLFRLAGRDLESLKKEAADRNFEPVLLDLKASVSIRNSIRTIHSNNVIARSVGSDPSLCSEHVVYMAHWDHLGQDLQLDPDTIYNGAVDNASGTAGLIAIAAAFEQLETPPRRSLLFLAVTAEEQGLLGSRYYAENPIYPLAQTVAAINMDAMNVLGPTRDVTVVGMGNSTLDDVVRTLAAEQGRSIRPDPEPEKGFFYRSDHFSFAKQGVPALYLGSGVDYVGRPAGWGRKMRERYTREDYHKPSDEVDPDWDLSGLVEDLKLLFSVGYQVANQERYPQWKQGTEFKAKRDAMLRKLD